MGLTFKQILAEDFANVFTNLNEFGESLVYKPKDGTARTIAGVVDEEGDYQADPYTTDNIEVLSVSVLRDATTGIDSPVKGDSIYRVIDGSSKCYSYSGQKMDVDESSWTLQFTREVPNKHGGLPKA